MNPDTNKFEPLLQNPPGTKLLRTDGSTVPDHWSTFQIDEYVAIKDYTFKVAYIGETSILFEPIGIPILQHKDTK